ncbi:zf-HC2 domain-containing protein [Aeromicrobium sp. NPDC092404]|uniref:anti-sigma factor n=1 Tax=Aeromicrobium sp. NPDC092404 TaxID=3154976 RepID=UPI003422BE07
MTDRHDELRHSLGAYVLGQLDVDARQEIEEHLATCAACRAERDELAPLAGLLRTVDLDALEAGLAPPPELDRMIAAALPGPTRRRARRWAPALAGAAVGVAATVGVMLVLPEDEPPPAPPVIAVKSVEAVQGVSATAGLVDHTWGVEIKLEADGLPAGETYEMWVVGNDGTKHLAGEFVGVEDKKIVCDMSSSVLLRDAARFAVVDTQGKEVIAADLDS